MLILFAFIFGRLTPASDAVAHASAVVSVANAPVAVAMGAAGDAVRASDVAELAADVLYQELGLAGRLSRAAFDAGIRSINGHGVRGGMLAIADLTAPSTAKRLFVVDLDKKEVVLNTYVAHGQNSGNLVATKFSNAQDSHQSSIGLYRVGAAIKSAKHGLALLLQGLDKRANDNALAREIIIHGAAYVSAAFIATHGRLGRSWGCPAVPTDAMPMIARSMADGGLFFVYGG